MKKVLSLFCVVLLLISLAAPSLAGYDMMYVNTSNGKSLNLRSSASTGNNVIAVIPNGELVEVASEIESKQIAGWSYVLWGNYGGYVQSRYLSVKKPSAQPSSETPTVDVTLKTLFKGFKQVDAYAVIAAPVGSYVNLRWAPSQEAGVIEKCVYGQDLVVIAQNKTWAQVRDDATGVVGFMMLKFIK